ncbi:hypothetical protein [Streptomyces sp. NPDC005374]|uniref:hypothetical protein n=1 Tax=Streptomyces sp. NPDC005374 TaxID=3364713 RepID=UPI003681CF75
MHEDSHENPDRTAEVLALIWLAGTVATVVIGLARGWLLGLACWLAVTLMTAVFAVASRWTKIREHLRRRLLAWWKHRRRKGHTSRRRTRTVTAEELDQIIEAKVKANVRAAAEPSSFPRAEPAERNPADLRFSEPPVPGSGTPEPTSSQRAKELIRQGVRDQPTLARLLAGEGHRVPSDSYLRRLIREGRS